MAAAIYHAAATVPDRLLLCFRLARALVSDAVIDMHQRQAAPVYSPAQDSRLVVAMGAGGGPKHDSSALCDVRSVRLNPRSRSLLAALRQNARASDSALRVAPFLEQAGCGGSVLAGFGKRISHNLLFSLQSLPQGEKVAESSHRLSRVRNAAFDKRRNLLFFARVRLSPGLFGGGRGSR